LAPGADRFQNQKTQPFREEEEAERNMEGLFSGLGLVAEVIFQTLAEEKYLIRVWRKYYDELVLLISSKKFKLNL
jgi:hypothetical protein